MKIKTVIEPFYELLFSNLKFSFKIMRFFGRIPFIRKIGFNRDYSDVLESYQPISIQGDVEPFKIISELREFGYSSKISVSNELLNTIDEIISKTPFSDRKSNIGEYYLDLKELKNPSSGYLYSIYNPHLSNDALYSFANDHIRPIADVYLGAKSVILNSQIWATFPDSGECYNPDFGFHYDLDDYRFLKLFIYLSDVDKDSGPHHIIESSHLGRSLFRFFHRRLEDDLPRFYEEKVRVMLGKKGEGFFEDTLCYHKGSRPLKPRMVLQIQFSLSDKK